MNAAANAANYRTCFFVHISIKDCMVQQRATLAAEHGNGDAAAAIVRLRVFKHHLAVDHCARRLAAGHNLDVQHPLCAGIALLPSWRARRWQR